MNQSSAKNIASLIDHIKQVDHAIEAAELTLGKIECRRGQETVDVVLGGVVFQLTQLDHRMGGPATPVPQYEELRKVCINTQKLYLFRLRGKAEGLRWKLREEAKKV